MLSNVSKLCLPLALMVTQACFVEVYDDNPYYGGSDVVLCEDYCVGGVCECYIFDTYDERLIDSDGDGIINDLEAVSNTDPYEFDTDGDGIWDGDEDHDSDGFSNAEEFHYGTHPADSNSFPGSVVVEPDPVVVIEEPVLVDSDGDGLLGRRRSDSGHRPLAL